MKSAIESCGGFLLCGPFQGAKNPCRKTARILLKLQLQVHLGDDGGAAGAQAVGVGVHRVHPAAGALLALGLADTDGQGGEVDTAANLSAFLGIFPGAGGDDANFSQIDILAGGLQGGILGRQGHMGFQSLADALVGTGLFQNAVFLIS